MYGADDLDLAGFALGIVERDAHRRRRARRGGRRGDRAGRRAACTPTASRSCAACSSAPALAPGDAPGDLLAPTRIYARAAAALRAACDVRAMAHITGGGIPGNLPRVLPEGLGARVDERRWPAPGGLRLARRAGRRAGRDAPRLQRRPRLRGRRARRRGRARRSRPARRAGCEAWQVGEIVPGEGVEYAGASSAVRLGVLVSGSGSNLQALIERVHGRSATIVGVCSSNGEAFALERAARAGIESARLPARRARRRARARATARWPTGWPSATSSSSSAPASWAC